MNRIKLFHKTGFKIRYPETEVIIRDENGLLFYSTECKTPNVKEFNIPIGEYWIDSGYVKSTFLPVNYPYIPLPKRERYNKPSPFGFKIVYGNNPFKCSILWLKKAILFDASLLDYTRPERDFILCHEYAHQMYRTEKYCDLKAANLMIEIGYNPIQIGMAQIDSLSNMNIDRKHFLVDMLCKTYGKNYL
jgi:hypothetical protein